MRFNHYYCPRCRKNTYTRNPPNQITPMFLACKRTPECPGVAESGMFALDKMIGASQSIQVTHEFYTDSLGDLCVRSVEPGSRRAE